MAGRQPYAGPRYSGGRKVLVDSPEELHLFEPGMLTPAPHVAEHIPDAGTFFVDWATRGLPAGAYYYELRAGSVVETRKLMVAR